MRLESLITLGIGAFYRKIRVRLRGFPRANFLSYERAWVHFAYFARLRAQRVVLQYEF